MRLPRAAYPALTAALWAMVIVVSAYVIWLLVPGTLAYPLVDAILFVGAELAILAVFVATVIRTRASRPAVILVGLAVTSTLVGDIIRAVEPAQKGMSASPTVVDVAYLLYYPLMLCAFILMLRRNPLPGGRISLTVVLDAAVAALGSGALLAALLTPALSDLGGESVVAVVIAASYPALSLLLLAIVGAVAASPSIDLGKYSLVFVFGLLAFAAGDVVFAILDQAGQYRTGVPGDALWIIGLALFSWWAAGQAEAEVARPRDGSATPILTTAVLTALAVLVAATQMPVAPTAIVLAAAALGLAAAPVILRQIEARRLLEGQRELVVQLQELDRAKSEMLATVNHEIRTPLTSVRGYIELVIQGEGGMIPPEASSMLQIADHNAERLAVLVDDMLTMSRLDAGSAKPDRQPVDLRRLLYRVVASLQPFASSRKVSLDIDEADADVTVIGDEAQLERAFTNLTQNALKFTPAGGSVGIEMELDDEAVIVRVIDTGMGIPEHDLPFLFGRFYRASNAQKGAVPGTGLGLAIVHSLLRANHGEVSIASTVDVGTTVRVSLPIAR
jgi:signal transduction histidine kinase